MREWRLWPSSDGRAFREHNDCHDPASGRFCSEPGAGTAAPAKTRAERVRGQLVGKGYEIAHRLAIPDWARGPRGIGKKFALNAAELQQAQEAPVYLLFEPDMTAHLGSPVKWTAPNGVTVFYDRSGRRDPTAIAKNLPATGVYHDFKVGHEKVIALTRNVSRARRALRAWAKKFTTNVVSARWNARMMVRPGD